LVNEWIENDEEFGGGFDSLDDEFCNEFLFDNDKRSSTAKKSNRCLLSYKKQTHSVTDIYNETNNDTNEIYKNELENKEKEICY